MRAIRSRLTFGRFSVVMTMSARPTRRLLFTYIELHAAEFRKTYEGISGKAIAAQWGVPMAENAATAQFTVLYPFQGDGHINRSGVNSADYHIEKIEERLKEAGILQ